MKQLSSSVALVAVLAFSAPVSAGSGAVMQVAAGSSVPETTSAMPPQHRHARAPHHTMRHGASAAESRGQTTGNNSANQLNQQELSRLQSGGSMSPSAAPAPGSAPPSGMQLQGPRPSSGR